MARDSAESAYSERSALESARWADRATEPGVEELGLGGDLVDLDAELADSDFSDILFGINDDEESAPSAGDAALDGLVAAKLAQAASQARYRPRTGGVTKKSGLVSFGPEDFEEGPQRDAFVIIREHKAALFGCLSAPAQVFRAIKWFFTDADDGLTPTFELCCGALDVRTDVLRLRLQYEFFLRWWVAPRPFPFDSVAVPQIILREITYVCPDLGRDIAELAWVRPGITTEAIVATIGHDQEVRRDLTRLDERMLVCEQGDGNWYLTGRNPLLLRQRLILKGVSPSVVGGSMHWGRLF